jgi:hypothetical protein
MHRRNLETSRAHPGSSRLFVKRNLSPRRDLVLIAHDPADWPARKSRQGLGAATEGLQTAEARLIRLEIQRDQVDQFKPIGGCSFVRRGGK